MAKHKLTSCYGGHWPQILIVKTEEVRGKYAYISIEAFALPEILNVDDHRGPHAFWFVLRFFGNLSRVSMSLYVWNHEVEKNQGLVWIRDDMILDGR